MRMSLYKINKLREFYPLLNEMIEKIEVIQQGQGPKSTIVEVYVKEIESQNDIPLKNLIDKK